MRILAACQVVALAGIVASCSPSQMRTARTLGLVETGAMLSCDYGQTQWVSDGGRWDRRYAPGPGESPGVYDEQNPLLGRHPSLASVGVYLAGVELGLVALNASGAPDWVKNAAIGAVAVIETANVLHNNNQPLGNCGL